MKQQSIPCVALIALAAGPCTTTGGLNEDDETRTLVRFEEEGPTPTLVRSSSDSASKNVVSVTSASFAASHEHSPAVVGEGVVAFVSDQHGQLDVWYVDYADGNRRADAELVSTAANEKAPCIVADGELDHAKVYFVTDAGGEVQIYSGSMPKVTSQGWEVRSQGHANWPDVSGDGRRMVYSVLNGRGVYELWLHDFDGGGDVRLFEGQRARFDPTNPDRFVYTKSDNGRWSIWRYDLSGNEGNVKLGGQGDADNFDPAWSPDGRLVAYTSNETGSSDVWVMRADGSSPRRITSHGAVDCHAVWSEAGDELLFSSDRGGSFDIYRVSVADLLVGDSEGGSAAP